MSAVEEIYDFSFVAIGTHINQSSFDLLGNKRVRVKCLFDELREYHVELTI